MASTSGGTTTGTTSSGGGGSLSYPIQSSGSDEDLKRLMDQRKRMVSNRESARRSRMRKRKHLDELVTQLSQLREENNRIIGNISITMQHYTSVEAENSVLKARVAELGHRLESLDQMIGFMNQTIDNIGCGFAAEEVYGGGGEFVDEFMSNSLSCLYANQPILASSDMIQY
ncbi:hypothetical protein L6452_28262 [Arctium lappa]|uniref:Uncharacterized protein n=1 Tax=Arctium lappa TaxID=4217 RepID=A0ACB8ZXZ9_ARCLA|nr:hypothetical protein L6452_28262 [Arctium lappa]